MSSRTEERCVTVSECVTVYYVFHAGKGKAGVKAELYFTLGFNHHFAQQGYKVFSMHLHTFALKMLNPTGSVIYFH